MRTDSGQEYMAQEGRTCMMEIKAENKIIGKRIITTSDPSIVVDATTGKLIDIDEMLEEGIHVYLIPIN